jgi:hypothetical protein
MEASADFAGILLPFIAYYTFIFSRTTFLHYLFVTYSPGMSMSIYSYLHDSTNRSPNEAEHSLDGNNFLIFSCLPFNFL